MTIDEIDCPEWYRFNWSTLCSHHRQETIDESVASLIVIGERERIRTYFWASIVFWTRRALCGGRDLRRMHVKNITSFLSEQRRGKRLEKVGATKKNTAEPQTPSWWNDGNAYRYNHERRRKATDWRRKMRRTHDGSRRRRWGWCARRRWGMKQLFDRPRAGKRVWRWWPAASVYPSVHSSVRSPRVKKLRGTGNGKLARRETRSSPPSSWPAEKRARDNPRVTTVKKSRRTRFGRRRGYYLLITPCFIRRAWRRDTRPKTIRRCPK